jgi:hypothetical protein|nr:MAG TPA: hypothetical protein [Caudoviricetes sp.]
MKNIIINTINALTMIIFIISALCVDSETWVPMIICAICLGWWLLFCVANIEGE